MTMKPLEAMEQLAAQGLPLILSFPLEEGKGHLITGKGICYVDRIHGTSRLTLNRFSPAQMISYVRRCASFYVTFELGGKTYGCFLRDLSVDGSSITVSVPDSLSPFMRRFLRVEPSRKSPVFFFALPKHSGTIALHVRDVSECGFGIMVPSSVELEERFVCGVLIPSEAASLILMRAVVVYRADSVRSLRQSCSGRGSTQGIFYGLETYPHPEDQKRLRVYIMQREVEIRRLLVT